MQPSALECQSRIREAATDADVVSLVRGFIAGLDPAQLALLPRDSRPESVADREDIMALNVQLARAELLCGPSDPNTAILRHILSVTTLAAQRFTQLSAEGLLGPPSER